MPSRPRQTDEETAVVALESADTPDDDLGDAGGYTDPMRGQR